MALSGAERQKRHREKFAETSYRFQLWLDERTARNLYKLSKRSGKTLRFVTETAINRLAKAYGCND